MSVNWRAEKIAVLYKEVEVLEKENERLQKENERLEIEHNALLQMIVGNYKGHDEQVETIINRDFTKEFVENNSEHWDFIGLFMEDTNSSSA